MSTTNSVSSVVHALERAYPPHLAESWDAVGLICGDPEAPVTKVAFALDCTETVADQAIAAGAQMLVVHHPLLLRGVTSVAADTPKGKIIHKLIRNNVALFAAHTNADSARPGVNDQLATLCGITPGRPLAPKLQGLDKWGVQIPAEQAAALKDAIFSAGAGEIGEYSQCAFSFEGQGQFLPSANANPTRGTREQLKTLKEMRIEFVAPRGRRNAIMHALREAHPYEEPAFDITQLQPTEPIEQACGLGRIGTLEQPMRFEDYVQMIANQLPATAWGVRAAGDPDRQVQCIAVSSGAGDGFIEEAAKLGADVFLSSDLRHHPVDEALRAFDLCIIDTAHWASEYPWTSQASQVIAQALPDVEVEVLATRTDPWTIAKHPQDH
ncbi:Nif3-like dinuclear metal center hexameric protein [Corynebacterium pseudopelargi]|uniref:GTP cyclohydrolase 1 type 2 homolog n=1 Tax=Corynebacterium pseudopelargi TaxID=2080757 RepID=A0A3G6ITC4_9CORY|nr:Nif3-like dinuclear metal center hexameric protein [Corynebacterium pseudopelargi]AZA08852.1 Putative GTP cyclohydrolase 1 type 2 [Corynebacterium pseudopelargi]